MSGRLIYSWLVVAIPLLMHAQAYSIPQESFEQVKSMPDSEGKADTLLQLAKGHWYDNPRECIDLAQYAYNISVQGNYKQKQADALNIIGAAYYFMEEIDSSIIFFNEALNLSYELDYTVGIARITNNLGLIHDYLGNYDEAIEYYYKSLEIEQESNNNEGIASSYLNIGSIYVYLEDYDRALEFMTNSLGLYQEAKDEDGILRAFTNIGTIYSNIGIPENALTYSQKALELSRKMNNPDLEAANLNNIGEIYFRLKNYTKSLENYYLALEIEQAFEDLWSKANTLQNIGNVYFEQKKYNKAKENYHEALSIALQIETKPLLKEIYHDFYSLYRVEENYEEALRYHVLYTDLKDSIVGESKKAEISRIESMNKLKYKDQQLEMVRKENEVKNLTINKQQLALTITLSLVLLVLLAIFIMYYRARLNRKSRDFLEKTNDLISNQKVLLEESLSRLKESEENYKALTNSIQDGVFIIRDRKLVFLNDGLRELLGYDSTEEVLKLPPDAIIAKQDFALVVKNYRERISGKDIPAKYCIRLIHSSGKLLEVELLVKLITLQDSPAIIGTIKDISKVRAYEKELIRAREKAEKATHSKSMFLAGMSHEIRNHLSGIIGIAELLGETKMSKDQREFVDVIKNSGDSLTKIINDILDLSKIESGQITLENKAFNMRKSIQEVIAQHELSATRKGITLKSDIDANIPETLVGDVVRLSQVLFNLIGNAIKFTDKGAVELFVNGIASSKEEIELKFLVKDTGNGISPENKEKLSNPFYQTQAAIENGKEGSGLGLVISKHLVMLMNGEIGVESEICKESVYWFTAKFGIGKEQIKPTLRKKRITDKNNRILIVEDNIVNQHLTTSILSKEGYEADIAVNGKEGLEMFMKHFYSVILMDIQMPVMDGMEATERIRDFEARNYPHKSTIIAITAHAKEGDEQRMKESGLDYFLSKPFKPDALIDIIRNLKN